MKNIQGFTLPEMVAVIAILMFLAVLTLPFVRGYIDDAYNGKAQVFMREIHEAHLNFEKDFPGTTINNEVIDFVDNLPDDCDIDTIYDNAGSLSAGYLVSCKYMKVSRDVVDRYQFAIGAAEECENIDDTALVTMIGKEDAGNGTYYNKCVWLTPTGQIKHN